MFGSSCVPKRRRSPDRSLKVPVHVTGAVVTGNPPGTHAGSYGGSSPEPILYNFDGFELEPVIPLSMETQTERIAVDPAVGFAVGKINPDKDGSTAYYVSNGIYFVLAVVTGEGVVLVDAPQSMASLLAPAMKAIAGEDAVVSHLVYSHAHQDHISGAAAVIEAFPDAEVRLVESSLPTINVYSQQLKCTPNN